MLILIKKIHFFKNRTIKSYHLIMIAFIIMY